MRLKSNKVRIRTLIRISASCSGYVLLFTVIINDKTVIPSTTNVFCGKGERCSELDIRFHTV